MDSDLVADSPSPGTPKHPQAQSPRSGVAEPKRVKENFDQAKGSGSLGKELCIEKLIGVTVYVYPMSILLGIWPVTSPHRWIDDDRCEHG